MKNGFYVIDADRHLMEPADLWYRYIDAEFKDRAPYGVGEFGATTVVDGVQNNAGTTFNGMDRETLKGLRNTQGLHTGFSKDIHWRYQYYDAIEESFSPKSYIVDMDKENIDAGVLFGSALLYFNWRDNIDIDLVDASCRAYNDWLHEYCSYSPNRMFGIAAVPMQDPERAIKEAQRAADLGHVGFYLRPNPLLGKSWHHSDYDNFYSAVEELGRPICFHEGGSTNMPQARLPYNKTFYSRHAMSHPFEQMLAVISMAGHGGMERHPNLKVFFAEATCGWVPFLLERLDWLYKHDQLGADVQLKNPPSFYFRRQGMVSCESGEETLPSYEKLVGPDHLLWASDYPHPDQIMKFPYSLDPMISETSIPTSMIEKVLWDNPNKFFNLKLKKEDYGRTKEAA